MMQDFFWQSFQAWEKQVSEAWDKMIRAPEFIDKMSQQIESSLHLKQQFDRAVEASLKAAMLPTAADQERMMQLIHQLEDQVQQLSDRVDRLSAGK